MVPVPLPDAAGKEFSIAPFLPNGCDLLVANIPLHRPPSEVPWVEVLHGNRRDGARSGANTIHVSEDHARRHGSVAWVHNGIDPAEVRFQPRKGRTDLFLGRLHAVKGYHWAIA